MSSNVVIRKNGSFYNVFDDDAIIISYLTGYKIKNGKCFFRSNSLNKVIEIIESNSVNYMIRENMVDIYRKSYRKGNKYNKVLSICKKKFNIDNRITNIINKINELSFDRKSELLERLEDILINR